MSTTLIFSIGVIVGIVLTLIIGGIWLCHTCKEDIRATEKG